MNKFWAVLIVITLLCSSCNLVVNLQNYNWNEFVSNEGKFKVMFPDIPQISYEIMDWNNQKLCVTKFEVLSQSYFGARYTEYPDSILSKYDLKYIYDFQRDTALKWTNAELINERDIWLNGRLGREIIVNQKSFLIFFNSVVTYRFYVIGNRTYQLDTSIYSSLMENEVVVKSSNKFLNSFELIER